MLRLPRIPKAVLFDMDGLMFDTEALYRDATITAARNAGFELPLWAYLETIGLPASNVRDLLLARFGKDAPLEDFWRQASELFTQMVQTDLRTKTGLPEVLSLLDAERIPSAVVTSSSRIAVEAHLSAAGLQARFQTIVAYGDYIWGKPHPAPMPDLVQPAADLLGHCACVLADLHAVRDLIASSLTLEQGRRGL